MSDADGVQRTEDGRYIVVNGRRWRTSDPSIPEKLRQELVDELMSARRAVKTSEPDAHIRVGDAKHALGERGYAWWDEPTPEEFEVRAIAAIRALLRKREGSSICPSDIARIVGGADDAWRSVMPAVREIAGFMAARDEVVVMQKGDPVDVATARGPVRIIRGPRFSHPLAEHNFGSRARRADPR